MVDDVELLLMVSFAIECKVKLALIVEGGINLNKVDSWIAKIDSGLTMHDGATIKEMMKEAMLDPAFDTLHENQEFASLVEKLKTL